MLPASLLSCDFRRDAAIPRFLNDADRPWIRALIDECQRAVGRPVRELEARLREPITGAPNDKQRLVAHLLVGFARSRVASPVPPREARAAIFTAAARREGPREEIVARCAESLGAAPGALLSSLFADLPGERLAIAPPSLDPGDVALRANLALAQGLLAHAHSVRIALEGNARAVVRHAALRGPSVPSLERFRPMVRAWSFPARTPSSAARSSTGGHSVPSSPSSRGRAVSS